MVTQKKTSQKKNHSKKPGDKKDVIRPSVPQSRLQKTLLVLKKPFVRLAEQTRSLMTRRPHRSFVRTRRRDYARSLKLSGFWSFTNYTRRMLWQHKKLFFGLVIVYGVLVAALAGLASQETYTQLSEALRDSGSEIFRGDVGELGRAGLLLGTGALGALNSEPTDLQRLYAILLGLMVWLTTVWLLRGILAGGRPKLRDGLYNAGAPFLSTFLVSLVLIVQLVPIALALIGFGAATASGLLEGGVEAMLFWTVALLLGALSLYWITTTFIALIVVTLPGMYPWRALKTAGDLVIGRRLRILLRLLWLMLIDTLLWVLIMVPIILLDTWLKGAVPDASWVPVVPIALLIMGSFTIVWSASYIYLLYRKVVDDDAAPA